MNLRNCFWNDRQRIRGFKSAEARIKFSNPPPLVVSNTVYTLHFSFEVLVNQCALLPPPGIHSYIFHAESSYTFGTAPIHRSRHDKSEAASNTLYAASLPSRNPARHDSWFRKSDSLLPLASTLPLYHQKRPKHQLGTNHSLIITCAIR